MLVRRLHGVDGSHRYAQSVVDRAHPVGVAAGQVIVLSDQVGAAAEKAIQVQRQGGDESLAFAGLHLGDPAVVKDGAAHKLHVIMAQAQGAAGGFAHRGESGRYDLLETGVFQGDDLVFELIAVFLAHGDSQLGSKTVDVAFQRFVFSGDFGFEAGGFGFEFLVGERHELRLQGIDRRN